MSVEVEKEITVVIPSSKIADPEFIQQEVTKAKLRVLIEVHKGSDKTLFELIKEFLPDVIENKALLREFNITALSNTEFKLKLPSSEKKFKVESSPYSKKESESVSPESVKVSEDKKATKPIIISKKCKPKSRVKISKKVVSIPKDSVEKSKDKVVISNIPVESEKELTKKQTDSLKHEENPKIDSFTANVCDDDETLSVAKLTSVSEQSKPKKKKILKLLKKKKTNKV